MKQDVIAKNILSLLDDKKRRKTILTLAVLLMLTFAAHCMANRWESPLALLPRTFTGILIGYLFLYLQSILRYPLIRKYFNIEALQKDAQQSGVGSPDP